MINQSTFDFINQLSARDSKDLQGKTLKACEEIGTLAKKVLAYTQSAGSLNQFVERASIVEECCDGMLCLLSILHELKADGPEVDEVMMTKATKWHGLQEREYKINEGGSKISIFPIPFEIHVTVQTDDIQGFKDVCQDMKIKPIVLELQNKVGDGIMQEVMTSSTIVTDNSGVQTELAFITNTLKSFGYNVVREKIETAPWHPAAPVNKSSVKPGSYYESHLNILVKSETSDEMLGHRVILSQIAIDHQAHLSRNVFKQYSPCESVLMMTLRSSTDGRSDFEVKVGKLKEKLQARGFIVEKVIVEYALYDSQQEKADHRWLNAEEVQPA